MGWFADTRRDYTAEGTDDLRVGRPEFYPVDSCNGIGDVAPNRRNCFAPGVARKGGDPVERLVRQFYFFFSSSSVAFACGADRKIASSKEQG